MGGRTGAYFRTNNTGNQWWRVDFGQERHIELVRINNRADWASDRLATSTIRVGNIDTFDVNAVCATISGIHDISGIRKIYSVACSATGRYLFVVMSNNHLHFTELEAYESSRSQCTQCDMNQYKAGVGPATCADRLLNSVSPAGSIINTACQCNAGYTGANGVTCTQCGAGTYKAGLGSGTCVGCPSNSTSPAGSIINTACRCNAGYMGANGAECP